MRLKFLYWNTENKNTAEPVLDNILEHSPVDILILGEAPGRLSQNFIDKHSFSQLFLTSAEREILKTSFYFRNNSKVQFRQIGNFNEIEASDSVIPDLEDRTIIRQEIIEVETIRRVTRRISRITMIEMTVEEQPYLLACLHFPSKISI